MNQQLDWRYTTQNVKHHIQWDFQYTPGYYRLCKHKLDLTQSTNTSNIHYTVLHLSAFHPKWGGRKMNVRTKYHQNQNPAYFHVYIPSPDWTNNVS